MTVGIRELKDNLSHFVRRVEAGERVQVTAHGRVVAELVPPLLGARTGRLSKFDALIAQGVVAPATTAGDPTEGWPAIKMPPGSARQLIDEDRGDA